MPRWEGMNGGDERCGLGREHGQTACNKMPLEPLLYTEDWSDFGDMEPGSPGRAIGLKGAVNR
jgi:hypothetical protein